MIIKVEQLDTFNIYKVKCFTHLRKSVLGECNELLLSRGTDVESYRQQALQSGDDETRLHRVSVAFSLYLLPLLVRNDPLR